MMSPQVSLAVFAQSEARRWGDQYLTFEVERTSRAAPNKARVRVFNLGLESIRFIEGAQAFALYVGESQLYMGDIARRLLVTKQEGADRVTELEGGDGREALLTARAVLSYPPGTPRVLAVRDAIRAMGLATSGDAPDDGSTFPAGWAYAGRASGVLDELAQGWSVQSGVIDFGGEAGRSVLRIAEGSGLIGSPERTDKGTRANMVLRADVRPHTIIELASRFVAGYYRVVEARHIGDSRGSEWRTECLCRGL